VVPAFTPTALAFDAALATAGQAAALAKLPAFFADPSRRAFLLCGAAGTGKTWTTCEIVRALLAAGYRVIVTATSNKAVRVQRANASRVSCPRAREAFARTITVSRFLHRKRLTHQSGNPSAREQRDLGLDADAVVRRRVYVPAGIAPGEDTVVIVDEVSMLSPRDAGLMLERCPKVLFIGDRHQLPPVAVPDWLGRQTPDAELTEVMRQAAGSGIALFGQAVRECRDAGALVAGSLEFPDVGDLRGLAWDKELGSDGHAGLDMILAHQNATCGAANVMAGQARFPGWMPGDPPPVGAQLFSHEAYVVGERVAVGKACQLEVLEVLGDARSGEFSGWRLRLRNSDEGGEVVVPCLAATFAGLAYQKTAREKGAIEHGMAEIGFGYALTVHKSQGSEWPNVLLIDDHHRARDGEQFRRWLYTGVTRAKSLLLYARAC